MKINQNLADLYWDGKVKEAKEGRHTKWTLLSAEHVQGLVLHYTKRLSMPSSSSTHPNTKIAKYFRACYTIDFSMKRLFFLDS
jgi:hypothetical protein